MPFRNRSVTTIIALVFATLFSAANAGEIMSPWKIQETLASKTYVDLTHEFQPGIPRWPGFPDETRKTIYWYEKRPDTLDADFFSKLFTHVGQWGTYVDPPAHFIKGLRPSIRSIEDRKITASRHETTDTDPGIATTKDEYSLETYILSTNHYQIELLTNLEQVPESGAIVVVSFPKPKGGSGFPARVFAILT